MHITRRRPETRRAHGLAPASARTGAARAGGRGAGAAADGTATEWHAHVTDHPARAVADSPAREGNRDMHAMQYEFTLAAWTPLHRAYQGR
ncbi:hypothetical protein GCM10010300_64110 [Streptomyces olivaceoviridis]|nr:hypothetical protein GCM10010300_64110 [Streptomyces olivaceoviridis]